MVPVILVIYWRLVFAQPALLASGVKQVREAARQRVKPEHVGDRGRQPDLCAELRAREVETRRHDQPGVERLDGSVLPVAQRRRARQR